MSLLIVGGAGYIGSVTSHLLVRNGFQVIVLDNLSRGHRAALPDQSEFIQGDLGDKELVKEICRSKQVEAALHFAAFTEVGESVRNPSKYFENNSVRTKFLLDALVESGVDRFIFSSTAATYGEPHEIPITENHPKQPTNPYGWSKLFVEQILDSYKTAYGLRSVIFRYFNAAGAYAGLGEAHKPESHLLPIVLQVPLGQRESLSVFGTDWDTPDGTCVRDYIHIADLGDAHLKGVELLADGSEGEVFNLGNGEGHSVLQVVQAARKVTGHPIPTVESPRRPGDPARLVASSAKARKELGWAPKIPDLEEIVRSAWDWHSSHPHGFETP